MGRVIPDKNKQMKTSRHPSSQGFGHIGLIIAVFVTIVIIASIAWRFVFNGNVVYADRTVKNDGHAYRYRFDVAAREIYTAGSQTSLRGRAHDGTYLIISARESLTKSVCDVQVQFQVTIEGNSVPVCINKTRNIYSTSFQKNSTWHKVGIFADTLETTPDEATVKEILNSMRVD